MAFFKELKIPALSFRQLYRTCVRNIFGEEGLQDKYTQYRALGAKEPGNIKDKSYGLKLSYLAKRKLFNPFKLLIEFPVYMLAHFVDWVIALLLPNPPKSITSKTGSDRPVIKTWGMRGREAWYYVRYVPVIFVRAVLKLIFKIPLYLIRRYTSPINRVFRPIGKYFSKHPVLYSVLVLGGALAVAVFLSVVIFTTAVAVPSPFLFIQSLLTMVANHIFLFFNMIDMAVAVGATYVAFSALVFYNAMAVLHNVVSTVIDWFGSSSVVTRQSLQKSDRKVAKKNEVKGVSTKGASEALSEGPVKKVVDVERTTESAKIFHTAARSKGDKPKEVSNADAFHRFFGR